MPGLLRQPGGFEGLDFATGRLHSTAWSHDWVSATPVVDAPVGDVYFCDPRSPWQRGSNENTNGLLRQYFPKVESLAGITQERLDEVAELLNRPAAKDARVPDPRREAHRADRGPRESGRALISLRPTAFARQRSKQMEGCETSGVVHYRLRSRCKAALFEHRERVCAPDRCAKKFRFSSALLRQPGGFEGLLTLGERLQPGDEAVPQREQMPDECLDLGAASLGLGAQLDEDRDVLAALNISTGSAVEDSNALSWSSTNAWHSSRPRYEP